MAEPVGALRVDVTANSAQIESDLRRIGGIVNSASAQWVRGMSSFTRGASAAVGEIFNLKNAIIGLAGGALVEAIKRSVEFGDNISKTAQKIGISTDSLQELRYGAALAGTATEDFDNILLQLSKRLGGAENNVDDVSRALGRLGIDVRTLSGLKADEVFKMIGDRIAAIKDPMQQAKIATELFGRTGQQVLPFLRSGSVGMADVAAEARKLGLVLGGQVLHETEAANEEFTRIGKSLSVAGVQMAAQFLPVLREFRDIVTSPEFQASIKNIASSTKEWIDYLIQHKTEVLTILGALAGMKIGKAFGPIGAAGGAIIGGIAGLEESRSKLEQIDLQMRSIDERKQHMQEVLAGPHSSIAESNIQQQLLQLEEQRTELVKQRAELEKGAATDAKEGASAALNSAQGIADHVVNTLKAGGANLSQIAGVLAALKSESNFNPNGTGDNGSAFGLFQWRGDRLEAMKQFASEMGTSISDVRTQLAFWVKEMGGSEEAANAMWKAAADPAQAAAAMAQFERFAGFQDKSSAEYQKRLALTQQYLQQLEQTGKIDAGAATSGVPRISISPDRVFDPDMAKAITDATFKMRVLKGEFGDIPEAAVEAAHGFEVSRKAIEALGPAFFEASEQGKQFRQTMLQQDWVQRVNSAAKSMASAFEGAFENAIFSGQSLRQVLSSLAQDIAKIFLKLALMKPLENFFTGIMGSGLGGAGAGGAGLLGGLLPGFATGGSFMVGGSGGIDSQLVAFRASPTERIDISTPGQQRDMNTAAAPVNVSNPVRIVNAFDSPDLLSHALSQSSGERVLMNFVRANSGAFKSALAG